MDRRLKDIKTMKEQLIKDCSNSFLLSRMNYDQREVFILNTANMIKRLNKELKDLTP